jgi:peptidase E
MALKQIITLGGGGFSEEPDNPLLDLYVLKQSNKEKPKICFLPTASGDSERYCLNFYESFKNYHCSPSIFSFFKPSTQDLEDFFLQQDIIYVGGGNTFSMLAIWKAWHADKIFKKAHESGVILAGISAGAICWFEHGHTDSFSKYLDRMECLGFLKGSCSPHYNEQEGRRSSFHSLLTTDKILPGYGIANGAAIHFVNGEVSRVVSSRQESRAYFVSRHENRIVEDELHIEFLGTR